MSMTGAIIRFGLATMNPILLMDNAHEQHGVCTTRPMITGSPTIALVAGD